MSKEISINDFLWWYPDQDNPYFNAHILKREEFAELVPQVNERTPLPGKAFIHQKFGTRFILCFDKLLLMHEPGSGKSTILVHSAEHFKNKYNEEKGLPLGKKTYPFTKVIVLTEGSLMQKTLRHEIITRSEPGTYETEKILGATSEVSRDRAINKEIRQWYYIMGYTELQNYLEKLLDPNRKPTEDFIRFMSNTVIYIDETHKLSTMSDREGKVTNTNIDANIRRYGLIQQGIRLGRHNKVVLMTATPMINKSEDMYTIMDLLLTPEDYSEDRSKELQRYANPSLEKLEPRFRGLISYIRRKDIGAIPKYIGREIKGIVLYPIYMNKEQERIYKMYKKLTTVESGETSKNQNFEIQTRGISNFIYPIPWGGYINEEGTQTLGTLDSYDMFITKASKNKQLKTTVNLGLPEIVSGENGKIFRNALKLENLEKYSPKFLEIFNIVNSKYYDGTETPVPDNKGICFISGPFTSVGADILSLIFQENGYIPFNHTERITNFDRFPKRKRYLLITPNTSNIHKSGFEVLNSRTNVFGEYIQVVIGSPQANHGISIKNAVCMIYTNGLWTRAEEKQVGDRVFRASSHDNRIAYIKSNFPNREPYINVEVYRMASIIKGDKDYNTADVITFEKANIKSKAIAPVNRIIKETAVDGTLNYTRNVRPTDIKGTEVCDYRNCDFTPHVPGMKLLGDKKILGGKLQFFMEEEEEIVYYVLRKAFKDKYILSLDEILERDDFVYENGKPLDDLYIMTCIEKLISSNTAFYDRLGHKVVLRQKNDILFLERNKFNLTPDPNDVYYKSKIIVGEDPIENNLLKSYIAPKIQSDVDLYVQALLLKPSIDTLDDLNEEEMFKVYEEIFIYAFNDFMENKPEDKNISKILEFFQERVYTLREPVSEINRAILNKEVIRPGRPTGRGTGAQNIIEETFYINFIPNLMTDEDEGPIFLYTRLQDDIPRGSVVSSHFNAREMIRVFKVTEGTWRRCNRIEYEVYQKILTDYRAEITGYFEKRFKDLGFYGIRIPPENDFRIRLYKKKWQTGKTWTSSNEAKERLLDKISKKYDISDISIPVELDSVGKLELVMEKLGIIYDGIPPTDFKEKEIKISKPATIYDEFIKWRVNQEREKVLREEEEIVVEEIEEDIELF